MQTALTVLRMQRALCADSCLTHGSQGPLGFSGSPWPGTVCPIQSSTPVRAHISTKDGLRSLMRLTKMC